ncbi:hypothetical protein [uncultured Serinicoccus sp.]|uniref:hypothetical protein n=1 Tax=uncultured Serinicoccus sp. TaxID=735514 RepID=UPI0026306E93|nr:hypothetical protein [uncultured Serinicoccus sp.]
MDAELEEYDDFGDEMEELSSEREEWIRGLVSETIEWAGDVREQLVEAIPAHLEPREFAAAAACAGAVFSVLQDRGDEEATQALSRFVQDKRLAEAVLANVKERMTYRSLRAPVPWQPHAAVELLTELWASRRFRSGPNDDARTRDLLEEVFGVDQPQIRDALIALPIRPLHGYRSVIESILGSAPRSVQTELERLTEGPYFDARRNWELTLMTPGAPGHLVPIVNDLALLKTSQRRAQREGVDPSDRLHWHLRAPLYAVESLTAGEFAWMEVHERGDYVERALVRGLLSGRPASPDPAEPWHGLYGGLPWWSFPAEDVTAAAVYPRTRELGLIREDSLLGIFLVDKDRDALTEEIVFDLDDVSDVAELVLLCRSRKVGVEGVVHQGDSWRTAAARTIDLEEAFCDAVLDQVRPSVDRLVALGEIDGRWVIDVFAGYLFDLSERMADASVLWRDLLPPAEPEPRPVPAKEPVLQSDQARPAAAPLHDTVVAQRLRRLWTDELGPWLDAEGHDLGSAWPGCSLERRGKVLLIHVPYDFGQGDPLAEIKDEFVERVAGATGGRVDQVKIIDRSASRFVPPKRRAGSSGLDVFHAGDPVGGLHAVASEIRRRLSVVDSTRPALSGLGLVATSRWRMWFVAESAEARRLVGSTPGAAFAIHDAVRRWQGTPDPQWDVIDDHYLWGESPGVLD